MCQLAETGQFPSNLAPGFPTVLAIGVGIAQAGNHFEGNGMRGEDLP